MTATKRVYILLVVLGILVSALVSYQVQIRDNMDNDTFWHIKTGEYIFTHREVPDKDVFSWYGTENNLKWINHEWLYDLIIYAVQDNTGLKGVVVFTALTVGYLFLILYLYIKIRTKNRFAGAFLGFAAISGVIGYIHPRPLSISFCLLITMAVLLERKKWLWILPVLLIGVNIHGGFYPMYLLLIIYYSWREKPVLIAISALLVILNPYGLEMLAFPFKIQMYPYFAKYISEWNPTRLSGQGGEVYLFIYLLLLVAVFNKKIKREDAVFSVLFIIQSLTAMRHTVFLFLLVIPVLSPYIAQNSILAGRTKEDLYEYRLVNFFSGALVLLLAIFMYTFDFGREVNMSNYPRAAIGYIKENNIERICNMYGDGGYLIYNGIKPMIDGRADIFAPIYNNTDLFINFMRFYYLEEDWQKFLDKYNVKYLLIKKSAAINRAVEHSSLFTVVYKDDLYIIYKYRNN